MNGLLTHVTIRYRLTRIGSGGCTIKTDDAKSSDRTPLKRIAGFELLEKVGQGAMGSVFKARQKSLDRIVALKLLPPKIARNKNFIERFVREARASAKLTHPNVVAGIDVGQDGPTELWYFAMEFVNGPTAGELLKKKGRLPEDQALKIARDIANALECARQNGLVHRDVKPDNILLNEDGTAKLADLGLVRHRQDDAGLTQSGAPMGTPFYMAPELVRGEVDGLDTRADLYGLGATLFHLVTGQPPFQGETAAVVMAKHLSDPPPLANRVCSDVSSGCSKLIQKLMQKDKSQRLQTPQQLMEQIDRLLKLPAAGRTTTTGPRVPIKGSTTTGTRAPVKITAQRGAIRPRGAKPESRPTQQNPAALYGAIVGGVVLLGVVFIAISSSQGPQPKPRPSPRVSNNPVSPPPSHPERPAASYGPTLEQRWREAKAFAEANPDAFDQILQRYRQVADAAADRPLATEIRTASRKVEADYEKAAQNAWQLAALKIDGRLAGEDYDGALAIVDSVPSTLAARLMDKLTARRQAIEDEANGKIEPFLEKARAASAAADPAAGLAALAKAPALKFQPATRTMAELKQQLERELANVDQLRASKAKLEADKKLSALLARFDTALLEQKNESAAAQVAQEAKGAADLEPVRAQADAMATILDAYAAERKHRADALQALKGKPYTLGEDPGTIERFEKGLLYVRISLDGGKMTAVKPVKISELTQDQRNELFPPPEPTNALRVGEAIRKLSKGQEDLDGTAALLEAAGDFPLARHYLDVIENRRAAVTEIEARKAWDELVALAAQPIQVPEQAQPIRDRLASFTDRYGKTAFAKDHAEQLAELMKKFQGLGAIKVSSSARLEIGEELKPGALISFNRQYRFSEVDETLLGLQHTQTPHKGAAAIRIRAVQAYTVYACVWTGDGAPELPQAWERTDLKLSGKQGQWHVWKTTLTAGAEIEAPAYNRFTTVVLAKEIKLKDE